MNAGIGVEGQALAYETERIEFADVNWGSAAETGTIVEISVVGVNLTVASVQAIGHLVNRED